MGKGESRRSHLRTDDMITTILAIILVLGAVIVFHEIGHFLFARLCGVGVDVFSVGFGRRLVGRKIGLTDYRISAIPLGGYVKMVGEEPGAEVAKEDLERSYMHKHVSIRMLIAAAGPAFNFLLAVLIYFVVLLISGVYVLMPTVGSVTADSPAQAGGMKDGDLITAINGTPISTWEEMAVSIDQSDGAELAITVQREGMSHSLVVVPERVAGKNMFGEDVERSMIGISSGGDTYLEELTTLSALSESLKQTYAVTELIVTVVVKLIKGSISFEAIGGPIMIADMAGERAEEGVGSLVLFIAFISINLAILNLLPIPVLDGGHLLFFAVELVIGRPVSLKIREIASQAGFFALIILTIYVLYNDIVRVFFS